MATQVWSFSTNDRSTWNQANSGNNYTLTGTALPSGAVISAVTFTMSLHTSRYGGGTWQLYYMIVSNGPNATGSGSSPFYTESMTGIDKTFTINISNPSASYTAFNSNNLTVAIRANNDLSNNTTWLTGASVTVTYTTPSTQKSEITSLTSSSGTNYATLNSILTVNFTKHDTSNRHVITWKIGSTTETQAIAASSSITGSSSYTIPASVINGITDDTSDIITCTLTTYNSSGTNIGQDMAQFIITVPNTSAYNPTATIGTISYTGQKTVSGTAYNVIGYTNIAVPITISAGTGASIVSCTIACTGLSTQNASASGTITFGKFTTSGTNTITLTVTDSRGRTKTVSTTVNVYSYTQPVISYSCARCNSSGTPTANGTYANINVSYTAGTLTGTGLSSVTVPVSSIAVSSKLASASSYGSPSGTIVASGGSVRLSTYTATSTYNIRIVVTDPIGSVTGVDTLYAYSNKIIDMYHSNTKDIIGLGADVQSNNANYDSGVVIGSGWKLYNRDGLIVGVGTDNKYQIIYSSTQPTGVVTGQLWLKPTT